MKTKNEKCADIVVLMHPRGSLDNYDAWNDNLVFDFLIPSNTPVKKAEEIAQLFSYKMNDCSFVKKYLETHPNLIISCSEDLRHTAEGNAGIIERLMEIAKKYKVEVVYYEGK